MASVIKEISRPRRSSRLDRTTVPVSVWIRAKCKWEGERRKRELSEQSATVHWRWKHFASPPCSCSKSNTFHWWTAGPARWPLTHEFAVNVIMSNQIQNSWTHILNKVCTAVHTKDETLCTYLSISALQSIQTTAHGLSLPLHSRGRVCAAQQGSLRCS